VCVFLMRSLPDSVFFGEGIIYTTLFAVHQYSSNLFIVIDFLKNILRICLIIFDAELPLGKLYAVQIFLNCLSASCPKRLQIVF